MQEWVGCAQNQNSKDQMEDVVAVRLFPEGGLFAVLDGHNGRVAVDFAATRLPDNILNSESFRTGDIQEAIILGFSQTERELCEKLVSDSNNVSDVPEGDDGGYPLLTSGVVICVTVLYDDVLYSANVGDCRAVLCRGSQPVQLTTDHNVLDRTERERVSSMISPEGYVKGLMVTRSLGNVDVHTKRKCEGQIAIPSLSSFPIHEGDFLIIASDGLYEVVTNEVAVATVHMATRRPTFTPQKAAQELVDRAIARGSWDNICVCVVMLGQRPTIH